MTFVSQEVMSIDGDYPGLVGLGNIGEDSVNHAWHKNTLQTCINRQQQGLVLPTLTDGRDEFIQKWVLRDLHQSNLTALQCLWAMKTFYLTDWVSSTQRLFDFGVIDFDMLTYLLIDMRSDV